jgi:serine/threonine-protein kinase
MSTGDFIIDKYKMLSPLATGTTTQVWEVTEVNSPKRVAMKLLLPEAFKLPVNKLSLKHEHKAGKVFDHPNIIKFHELVLTKKQGYIIMDLFRAPNVKQQIKTDLNMVHVRFKRFVELMCLALEHVHEKGWLHKDIKPDNMLINKGSELKLIDFSLSSPVGGALASLFGGKGGLIQGTRTYMAPEQILNKKLTFQTDLYSLGITLFEMLTGKPPFFGGTPKALLMAHLGETPPNPSFYNKNVTPEMDRIVSRLLSKKPVNRHKRATEVWSELRSIEVFKEAVKDFVAPTELEKQAAAAAAIGGDRDRLDSRADHLRQEAIKENPTLGVEHEAERAAIKSRKAASAAATAKRVEAATPAAPPAPVAPPTPAWPAAAMGGYPQPMPGMPMPFPGYPPGMPGYGMPPGYMPGMPYPFPQQPMMPPQMMPQPMMPPPMAAPPQMMPPVGMPVAPQPAAPQPSAPAPAQSRPAPAKPAPAAPRPKTPAAAAPAAKPKLAPAKPKPAAAPATPQSPSDGFNISDLDGFDSLESTK